MSNAYTYLKYIFETKEDNEAFNKSDIYDILSQGSKGDVTVSIQGSTLMKTSL